MDGDYEPIKELKGEARDLWASVVRTLVESILDPSTDKELLLSPLNPKFAIFINGVAQKVESGEMELDDIDARFLQRLRDDNG